MSKVKRYTEHGENNLEPFTPDYLDSQLLSVIAGEDYDLLAGLKQKAVLKVYYTPNNTHTQSILERVATKLQVKIKGKIFFRCQMVIGCNANEEENYIKCKQSGWLEDDCES